MEDNVPLSMYPMLHLRTADRCVSEQPDISFGLRDPHSSVSDEPGG